jgi:hypothetical protein
MNFYKGTYTSKREPTIKTLIFCFEAKMGARAIFSGTEDCEGAPRGLPRPKTERGRSGQEERDNV